MIFRIQKFKLAMLTLCFMQDIVFGALWMVCALVQQSLSDGSKEREEEERWQTDRKIEGETIMGCASAAGKGTHQGSLRNNDLRT